VPETYPDRILQGWIQVAAEQRAAGRLSVADAPGPHQAAGPFGEQAITAGIPRCHQPGRPVQKVRGDIG
jgi:hypothetical protein